MTISRNITLSIIIPLYNCEKFIGRCLDSIIEATKKFTDIEVIIINDGSKDSGEVICSQYMEQYPFIRLYTQKNKGASAARNKGLSEACGEYIWFVDADDTICTQNFPALYNYLKNNNPDIIVFEYLNETYDGTTKSDARLNHTITSSLKYLTKDCKLYLWNKIFSKHIIGETKFLNNTKNIEDLLFNIEVFIKDVQVHQLSCEGYIYNTTNNLSTSRNLCKRNLIKLSKDSLSIHRRLKQIMLGVDKRTQKILENLLNFSIGGHFYSLIRYYNCNYLFKVIREYKNDDLYPIKTTSNLKMNLFILGINMLWYFRFLKKRY